jgi:hypothetical protein
MSVDRTPDPAAEPGRTAPVGSSLPGLAGLWTRVDSGDEAHGAVVPEPSDPGANHESGPVCPYLDTQRQAQAQPVEQQLDRLKEYADEQGWPVPLEDVFRR